MVMMMVVIMMVIKVMMMMMLLMDGDSYDDVSKLFPHVVVSSIDSITVRSMFEFN